MATPTRWPNGITTVSPTHPAHQLGIPHPAKWHVDFDDMNEYTAANWTITQIDGGVDGAEVRQITNADGGVLLITTNDADDDQESLQKKGESFLFESGKKLYLEVKLKLSDATQSDLVFGLQITDTTPLAVTDGVFFQKDDGDANVDLHIVKDSTATDVTALTTMSDDTYIVLQLYYDGLSTIYYSADDALLGTAATTNLPDDEELCVSLSIKAGEAAAKSLSIDYYLVAKER